MVGRYEGIYQFMLRTELLAQWSVERGSINTYLCSLRLSFGTGPERVELQNTPFSFTSRKVPEAIERRKINYDSFADTK